MKLNHITNVDKNLQEKMRYFADCFSFTNEFLGRLPDVPFDNHLSLIDKTIFQIENNFEHCSLYTISYLSHFFTFYDKSIEPPAALLNKIENQFLSLKTSKDKKQWLKLNPGFLEDLKAIRLEYEETLFDKTYAALLTYIKCKHNLKKHRVAIAYGTRLLVSLFRINGHSKESLNKYIGRIIASNRYDFPFPPEILKIRDRDEYKKSTELFLANRDFDKQFEGLKNIFIADKHKSGYFFYVIENCIIDERTTGKFKVQLDKVTFISPEHEELKTLRKSISEYDEKHGEKTFPVFFGEEKLLAYVHLGYEDKKAKKDEGLRIVAEELLNFNQYCYESEVVVNSLHYFFADFLEGDSWSASTSFGMVKKSILRQSDFEELEKNTYEVLRNVNSVAKPVILECEKTFLKAFAREEVEFYWMFIENIFAPLTNKSEDVRKGFSKLMLKVLDQLEDNFLFAIASMLTPFGFDNKEEGLDKGDVCTIHEAICLDGNFQFDLGQYKKKIKSLKLRELIDQHKNFKSTANIHKWKVHFDLLLLDLYAYRNSLVHSGYVNEYARIKLLAVLPNLISRTRWLIIKTCKNNPALSYKELIETLIK
jgi:hypothetical protein